MTALDIIVLLLVGGAAIFGALRGFVGEILTLASWVAAAIAVKLFHEPLSGWLGGNVVSTGGSDILAFALILVVVLFGGKLLAGQLGAATRRSSLGAFDRVLGFGFGVVKGLIAATLLFLFATLLFDMMGGGADARPGWMVDARTYPLMDASSRALIDFVEKGRG